MNGLLALWLLCGLAAAVIARDKGRSGCGFFALGIILGPLGVIGAMIVGSDPAHALPTEPMKRCHACGEHIKAIAVKCRYCGEAVD